MDVIEAYENGKKGKLLCWNYSNQCPVSIMKPFTKQEINQEEDIHNNFLK